jgi:putative methionine-R-sulfoxide reductase with GAF domain
MIEMNVNRASRCEEVVDMELYNRLLEKYDELSKENHDLKNRLSNLEQLIIKMMCDGKVE